MEEKKEQPSKTLDWHVLFAKKNRFLLIGLVGICLLVLADALWSGGAAQDAQETAVQMPAQPSVSTEQALEERLTGMIESVQGAGKVRVMVTLEHAGETVYATDEKSDTQISDTAGTIDRRTSYENEHVFFDAQDGRQPLVETRLEPEVKGVAVVCEGGDDVTVIRRITDLVSVVLNLPSNRVCVTKMIDTEEAS